MVYKFRFSFRFIFSNFPTLFTNFLATQKCRTTVYFAIKEISLNYT